MTDFFATYLDDEGIGSLYDGTSGDLFVSQIPDSPDDVIVLFDEPGIDVGYQQAYASDASGLMVMTRGSYTFAKDKIWEIHWNIVGLTEQETDDYYLRVVRTQTLPGQLEQDDEGRRQFTAHYDILINPKNDQNRIPITNP